jgi:hypothetical protein
MYAMATLCGQLCDFTDEIIFDMASMARVARFFLVHDTETGKNVPNEHKMYQMNTECTK